MKIKKLEQAIKQYGDCCGKLDVRASKVAWMEIQKQILDLISDPDELALYLALYSKGLSASVLNLHVQLPDGQEWSVTAKKLNPGHKL